MTRTFGWVIRPLSLPLALFPMATGCNVEPDSNQLIDQGIYSPDALTADAMSQLDRGFAVFMYETFDGNGRTCGTCHIPEEQYNINKQNIAEMTGTDLDLVLGLNTPGLENPTLVLDLGLFNVEGGDALNPEVHVPDSHGPVFRGSMTVGPIALTTAGPNPALNNTGWAANATPTGFFHHGNNDPDADGTFRAFPNGAIAQHNPLTLDRVEGLDFRFATAEELDDMEAFQNWLGRREEFSIANFTMKDRGAEKGRAVYMSNEASCQTCHRDGGANFAFNHLAPPAGNISQHSGVDEERHRLSDETGVFIPEDEGIVAGPPGTVPFAGAFNIQPVIESGRKKAFFHNHAVTTDLEEAIAFYFREPFVSSEIRATLGGLLTGPAQGGDGSGNDHIDDLDDFLIHTGGEGIVNIGRFIRGLSAWYSIRDCERLVQETIDRLAVGTRPHLAANHCQLNLEDAMDVLAGAKTAGRSGRFGSMHHTHQFKLHSVKMLLEAALENNGFPGNGTIDGPTTPSTADPTAAISALENVLVRLERLRTAIATTPDLP